MIIVKHCGTSDVMYFGHNNGILVAGVIAGVYFMTMPLTLLGGVVVIRWSPLMMPYHVFGGSEKLVELESEGSVPYFSVFVLDWALMTAGVYGLCGAAAILSDTFFKIKLVLRAMR